MKFWREGKPAGILAVVLISLIGCGVLQFYTIHGLNATRRCLSPFAWTSANIGAHVCSLRSLPPVFPPQLRQIDSLQSFVNGGMRPLPADTAFMVRGRHLVEISREEIWVQNRHQETRSGLEELAAAEFDLFQQRAQAARTINHQAVLFILFGCVLGIAVVGAVAVAFRLDFADRSRSEARFRRLLESAPDAMVIANRIGHIVLINEQTEELFGYKRTELLGQSVEMLMPQRYRKQHQGHRTGYFQAPRTRAMGASLELRGLRKDGTEFPIEVSLSPLETQGEMLVSSTIRDITERKAAAEIVESQARFLNAANDAILVRDIQGKILYWNGGAERLYGWKREEALGKFAYDLLGTVFPEPFDEILRRDGQGDWEGEQIQRKRDGARITVASQWTGLNNAQNELTGWLEINRDISERKRAEVSLRALSGRLLQMQEDERRRIGRELHDSLGQNLSVLKMVLDSLQADGSLERDGAREKMGECIHLAEQSLLEVRTASYLLYPPMLDELGLQSAIPMYLEGFAKRSGIQTTFDSTPDFGRVAREIELALFRVLQESLTNVHRHSTSATAHVRIVRDGGFVKLEVKDDGKGIPPETLAEIQNGVLGDLGVGLRGMKERVLQFGGEFEVDSTSQGTTVRVTIPCGEPKPVLGFSANA